MSSAMPCGMRETLDSRLPCGGDAFVPVSPLPFPRLGFYDCTFCANAAHELWCGCGVTDDGGKCLGRLGYAFARAAGVELAAWKAVEG